LNPAEMPASDPAAPLTVSRLNREVRTLLESNFDYLWVEGEISNFVAPASGHWYFTLKDEGAQVRCAMFRNRNQRLRLRPENGATVRLRCRVSLYEARGEFQLIVEFMEPAGEGALRAAFEALKAKLDAEGLFALERKRPLPEHPRKIAVITSATGAAIHDILTVTRRRSPSLALYLLPVAVQGASAPAEICRAVALANRWHREGRLHVDALLLGRGGGSLEDLQAFNEESVARAIAASDIPVVSAVGHEVDISIADLVADQRAPTPSAAAELLSLDQHQQLAQFAALETALARQVRRMLQQAALELRALRHRLQHPGHRLREYSQRTDELTLRLERAARGVLQQREHRLRLLQGRLRAASPAVRAAALRRRTAELEALLVRLARARLQRAASDLGHLAQLLDSLSPLRVLNRGYAILTDAGGAVVRDAAAVDAGATLRARLAHGRLELAVTGRETDGEERD